MLILVGDLATGVMGEGSRYPFLETPNVRRLQREGVMFEKAFVSSSICSPSRASLLTGAYAHTHDVRFNDVKDLGETLPNFPEVLGASEYDTGFVGKWHMNNASSEPRLNFGYGLSFKGQGVYDNPVSNENRRKFRANGYITDIINKYTVDYI